MKCLPGIEKSENFDGSFLIGDPFQLEIVHRPFENTEGGRFSQLVLLAKAFNL